MKANLLGGRRLGEGRINVSFNSPVVPGFPMICLMVFALGIVTGGGSTTLLFCVYRSSPADPLTYVRLIVFGHAGRDHFLGNITMLLVVGPMLEEKYESSNNLCGGVGSAVGYVMVKNRR